MLFAGWVRYRNMLHMFLDTMLCGKRYPSNFALFFMQLFSQLSYQVKHKILSKNGFMNIVKSKNVTYPKILIMSVLNSPGLSVCVWPWCWSWCPRSSRLELHLLHGNSRFAAWVFCAKSVLMVSIIIFQLVEIFPCALVLFILRKLPPKRFSGAYNPINWSSRKICNAFANDPYCRLEIIYCNLFGWN